MSINLKNCKIEILVLMLISVLCFNHANARSGTRLVKNISRSFEVDQNTNIELTNKYGQVIVNTWEKDSVVIDVEITVYGKNGEMTEKMMRRVDIEFNRFGDFLSIETILDRNSGFFKEMWNSLGDYSKTLLSNNKINIDYEITIPIRSNFKLDNKFGDVFLNQHEGKLQLIVSHGDLKVNKLAGESRIDLSFGKGHFKNINQANMVLKSAELSIRDIGSLNIESSSSEIELTNVESLILNSRNDKISIEKVRMISGRASFSDVAIDSIIDQVNVDLNYGEFYIASVNANFATVHLSGKSADIHLNFEIGAYFDLSIAGRDDQIFLSKNFKGLNKTVSQEDEKEIILTGSVGMIKSKRSSVDVQSINGDIYLFLDDGGGITNR